VAVCLECRSLVFQFLSGFQPKNLDLEGAAKKVLSIPFRIPVEDSPELESDPEFDFQFLSGFQYRFAALDENRDLSCFQFLSGFQAVIEKLDNIRLELSFQFLSGFQPLSHKRYNDGLHNTFQFLSGFQTPNKKPGPLRRKISFNSFPDSRGLGGELSSIWRAATFNSFPDSRIALKVITVLWSKSLSIPFRIPEKSKGEHLSNCCFGTFNSFPDSSRFAVVNVVHQVN